MQIGSDAHPHPFEFYQLREAVTICRVADQADQQYDGADKPPTLPHRRQDSKLEHGRLAGDSLLIDGSHLEAVRTAAQLRVIDRAMLARRAPVGIGAFQLVLIPELLL